MSSIIKPRRGTAAPTTGIVENELVVDTTNRRIYIGNIGGSGDLIGSAPSGSDTYIQFNDSGNFGGDVGLTYNKTTDALTMLGDLNLNGGGIRTTQSSISIIPSIATTVNLGTSATTLNLAAVAGATTSIRGGTLVGNTTTQNLFNTTATTLNLGGAATTVTIGGTTGTASIRNAYLQLGNTTSSVTTNSGTSNSLTLSPYGNFVVTPTSSISAGGTFPSLVITNADQGLGQVQITGGDLYIGVKVDGGDVESAANIVFEGISDANELTLTIDSLTADRTVTLPDAAGTVGVMASPTNQQIQFYDSASKNLKGDADLTFDGTNLQIGSQGDLRLADSDSSNWVAFQAPATVSSNVTWTLPSADGNSGDVLTTNGSGTLSWATGGSGITRSVNNISTTTSAGSTASTDYVYNVTSGTFTITMPTAVSNTNRYTIKQSGTGALTIATTSSQTIDGSSTYTIDAQYQSIDLISNGSNWIIV